MVGKSAFRRDAAGRAANANSAARGETTRAVRIAQVVFRNVVPVVGILFLSWSASNVLILYFVDTMLSMAVMFAGLLTTFSPPMDGAAARINQEAGYLLASLFVCAFISIPLGLPIALSIVVSGFSFQSAITDHSLKIGLLVQTALALWSYLGLRRALAAYTPEQLMLKQRFGLVLMRWVIVLLASYLFLELSSWRRFLPSLGEAWLLVLVAVYVAASIVAEIKPELLLRGTPADVDAVRPRRAGQGPLR